MQCLMWITLVELVLYALFSFLYTTVVLYASGVRTSFLWFWPTTCFLACGAIAALFSVLTGHLPALRTPLALMTVLFWLTTTLLFGVFLKVYRAGHAPAEPKGQYVIILGAQVRGNVPSLVLDARIRKAAEYLKDNPEAIAVASGGQGTGENVSEAEAIRQGLIRYGISEDRILLEDQSTSTLENIRFSKQVIAENEQCKLLGLSYTRGALATDAVTKSFGSADESSLLPAVRNAEQASVIVVTNDFHVYRAVRVAKKAGFANASGCGATDVYAVTIQYYVRECIGIILEILRGTA